MSIALAYQHPGWVHEEFMHSVIALRDDAETEIEWTIRMRSGSLLGPGRSMILRTFLGSTTATHLLYVDADMIFSPGDLDRLMARDEALVGGLYLGQDDAGHIFATARARGPEGFVSLPQEAAVAAGGDLLAVGGMGMGFTLVRRDVAAAVAELYLHPFEECWIEGVHVDPDVAFCDRARRAGFVPYLDTSVKLGHIKERVLWP